DGPARRRGRHGPLRRPRGRCPGPFGSGRDGLGLDLLFVIGPGHACPPGQATIPRASIGRPPPVATDFSLAHPGGVRYARGWQVVVHVVVRSLRDRSFRSRSDRTTPHTGGTT